MNEKVDEYLQSVIEKGTPPDDAAEDAEVPAAASEARRLAKAAAESRREQATRKASEEAEANRKKGASEDKFYKESTRHEVPARLFPKTTGRSSPLSSDLFLPCPVVLWSWQSSCSSSTRLSVMWRELFLPSHLLPRFPLSSSSVLYSPASPLLPPHQLHIPVFLHRLSLFHLPFSCLSIFDLIPRVGSRASSSKPLLSASDSLFAHTATPSALPLYPVLSVLKCSRC